MDNLCDFVVRWAFCPAFRVRDRSPKGREGRSYPALGPLGGKIAARFRVKPGMTWEGRPQFYAARARPCAAGNARCRMRRPPVRRTSLSVCSLPAAESSPSWRSASWMTAGWWSVSPGLPRPVSGPENLFLSRICQNTSCDGCHYRKLPRIADITLGRYTLDQLIKMYSPFPSPLKRGYYRVRGLLGRVKWKAVG